jgi:hypothetical protein
VQPQSDVGGYEELSDEWMTIHSQGDGVDRRTGARVKEVGTRAQPSHGRLSAAAQRLVARQQYERMGTLMTSSPVNGS